jgi:hypothetical protein
VDVVQNVFHGWSAFDFSSDGFATRFGCRGTAPGCPLRVNMVGNHFTSAGEYLTRALLFLDGADPGQVYSAGNRFPDEEVDDGTATALFNDGLSATVIPEFVHVLDRVGHPFPTAEEGQILAEVALQVAGEI